MKNNTEIRNEESNPLQTRTKQLSVVQLSEVAPSEMEWVWKDRIPKSTLSIIEGDGGRGKSTIVTDICSRLSTGASLPDDEMIREPIRILLLASEDDPSTVLRPRFEAHNANLENILICDQSLIVNSESVDELKNTIVAENIKIVVIDPIVSFLGRKIDMNKANDVRSVMEHFTRLGRETECTFILIRHFNKSRDSSASQRGAGSVDFRNAARSVLQVLHDPENEQSYLALEKSNYAANAKALPFNIVDKKVKWGVPCAISTEELHSKSRNLTNKLAIDDAVDFLKETLTSPLMSKEVFELAKEQEISEKTLRRAAKRLRVKPRRLANGWEWSLLLAENQDGQDSQT